jgi:hypothetical protein
MLRVIFLNTHYSIPNTTNMSKPHWGYYLSNAGIPTLNLADNIAWKRNRIAYMEDQIAYERTLLVKMEEEFLEYVSTGKFCWTSKEISDAKIAFVKDTNPIAIEVAEALEASTHDLGSRIIHPKV